MIDEGDPYNELLFNKTINKLKSKGYFKTVNSNIVNGSADNLKILEITVEEKPTGEIYFDRSWYFRCIYDFLKENNFLGKGISLDTALELSATTIKGQFIYSKPNFNYTDNTLFTSISSTTTDGLTDFGYKTSKVGTSIGTRFQQYENLYFGPTIATSFENLKTTTTASDSLQKQKGKYTDVYFNYSLDYDLRNQSYQTSDGFRNLFIQEIPLYSESKEITNKIQSNFYKKPFQSSDMIFRSQFYASTVHSLGDKDVRISKRLYIPQSKLRGFESGRVGPVDNKGHVGGNYITTMNLSSTLPQVLPSFQNVDISVFFDVGNIWGIDYNNSLDDSKLSGAFLDVFLNEPLNFSFSRPLTKVSTDKTESFRFNLGTTF